jgi:hypothetical protein
MNNRGKTMDEKKEVKEICGNCRIYRHEKGDCGVVVINEGQKIHIPVSPEDKCFFNNQFIANPAPFKLEEFGVDIKEIKFWEEDGGVKIEFPEELFEQN